MFRIDASQYSWNIFWANNGFSCIFHCGESHDGIRRKPCSWEPAWGCGNPPWGTETLRRWHFCYYQPSILRPVFCFLYIIQTSIKFTVELETDSSIALQMVTRISKPKPPRNPVAPSGWLCCSAFPGLTENLKWCLTTSNIWTAVKPTRKIGDILQTHKDPVNPSKCQGVVYGIPCKHCPLQCIHETKRSLFTRKKNM